MAISWFANANSRKQFPTQRSKLSAVGSAHNILIEQPPSRDWLQPYRKDVGNTDLVFRNQEKGDEFLVTENDGLRFQCKAFKALNVQFDNPCNSSDTQYLKFLLLQH